MKKYLTLFFVFAIVCFLLVFTGYDSENSEEDVQNSVVGIWEDEFTLIDTDGKEMSLVHRFVFNEDGTGEGIGGQVWLDDAPDDANNFTYTLGEGEIYVKSSYDFSITCTYRFEKDRLILTIPFNPQKPQTYELTRVSQQI